MSYNIIGDIHGRTWWKDLVKEGCVNIFVGDYFSPYEDISFDDCKNNFLDIVDYKVKYPETILLIGNHDADHWRWMDGDPLESTCSRHDFKHEKEIYKLFEDNKSLFQAAYSTENILVTHAGVSVHWFNKYFYKNAKKIDTNTLILDPENKGVSLDYAVGDYLDLCNSGDIKNKQPLYEGMLAIFHNRWYRYTNGQFILFEFSPEQIAIAIEQLWKKDPDAFDFWNNASFNDYYGTTNTHSPMWIRPQTLCCSNIFRGTDYIQVFGHTQVPDIAYISDKEMLFSEGETGRVFDVDCLGAASERLIL